MLHKTQKITSSTDSNGEIKIGIKPIEINLPIHYVELLLSLLNAEQRRSKLDLRRPAYMRREWEEEILNLKLKLKPYVQSIQEN